MRKFKLGEVVYTNVFFKDLQKGTVERIYDEKNKRLSKYVFVNWNGICNMFPIKDLCPKDRNCKKCDQRLRCITGETKWYKE